MSSGYQTRMHILTEELNNYIRNIEVYGKDSIIQELKKVFPTVDNKDLDRIIELFILQDMKVNSEGVSAEFVTTIPAQLQNMGSRKTIGVLREYIHAAEHSILITGYSVSEFAMDLIQLLKKRSSEGVIIKFFIDKHVNESNINSIVGKEVNFKVYKLIDSIEYSNLHAKIAVFDSYHAFISSSNLSYNGIINNIEVGSLLHGKKVRELESIFEEMLRIGFFKKIN